MPTSKGLVFDIKRFAVHDGDGLRTTVFLKGCPLRCQWCQNPEGLDACRHPVFLASKCIGCQRCAACPGVEHDGKRPRFLKTGVDEAVDVCPSSAIVYDSNWYDVDALMAQIQKDAVFFRHGGGVTFSGGEPFFQAPFVLEMLKACRQAGIHTAIESSFYTSPEVVARALPLLDRIFCDLKLLDDEAHQKATGVSNAVIKKNIETLLRSEKRSQVVIRTPLIPGITGTVENVRAIARFISTIDPEVRYELLNYNPLAPSKYALYENLEYPLTNAKPFSKAEMERLMQAAREGGVKHIIME